MGDNEHNFALLLAHLRSRRGLYLIGAGASAGLVSMGGTLYRLAALDWLRRFGFSPSIPDHSPLGKTIIRSARWITTEELTGRPMRPGTEPYPIEAALDRLHDNAARHRILMEMAKFRFSGHVTDSYRVFRGFWPSVILNYNLDGLIAAQCGAQHGVINVHGVANPWYGSPRAERVLPLLRESNIALTGVPGDEDLVLCVPEDHSNELLNKRLQMAGAIRPDFIVLIGYQFAKTDVGYDDYVSLEWFERRFRDFRGAVFIISPWPEEIQHEVGSRLKSLNVIAVKARWNILSHVFFQSMMGLCDPIELYGMHETLLSRHGEFVTFPQRSC